MAQKVFSFHISEAMNARLAEQTTSRGMRSNIVRAAVITYADPPSAEHYLTNSPDGPYTVKCNVAYGPWVEEVTAAGRKYGQSASSIARYALARMLNALESEEHIEH